MSNVEGSRAKRKFVKRAPNYSDSEKRFLVDRILRSYPVILDKRVDNRTKQQKARAWELLAAEFNSQAVFVNRNPTTLRTCWENLKRLKKNDCIRSVIEPYLSPQKSSNGILEERAEVIDLDLNNEDQYDTKNRKVTIEVKIDEEDVVLISNSDAENCEQGNNANNKPDNMDPFSETAEIENFHTVNNVENNDWNVGAPTPPEEKKEKPTKVKKRAAKRLRVVKRRPVNIRNVWIKKKTDLLKTLKQHAEEYGKMLATQKIELFQTLKRNAEEEGKIKQLILEQQLRQEKIKTVRLQRLV